MHEWMLWEDEVKQNSWGKYLSTIEQTVIMKASSLVERPGTALDIGCEGGRWSKCLSEVGWKLICADIDSSVLKLCQQRVPDATCVLMHPEDAHLPCMTESLELVLCMRVAPVIQSSWFLDEAFRVLQPGGVLVGLCWNRLSMRGTISHFVASAKGAYDSYQYGYSTWRTSCRKQGFTIVHEEGFGWFPFRLTSDFPGIPVAIWIETHLRGHSWLHSSPWIVFIAQKRCR